MRVKVAILALMIFGMSACAYKTCPTYAKKDAKSAVEKKQNL